jgi:single-strand DNA-binding protein
MSMKNVMVQKNIAYAVIDGNLTNDPELKTIGSGKKVSTFNVAINHDTKDDSANNSDVSFIDIEVWDKAAENCSEYLKKGRKVTILGNLKQDRWKSADGANRNKWKVIATSVRFDTYSDRGMKDKEVEQKAA